MLGPNLRVANDHGRELVGAAEVGHLFRLGAIPDQNNPADWSAGLGKDGRQRRPVVGVTGRQDTAGDGDDDLRGCPEGPGVLSLAGGVDGRRQRAALVFRADGGRRESGQESIADDRRDAVHGHRSGELGERQDRARLLTSLP